MSYISHGKMPEISSRVTCRVVKSLKFIHMCCMSRGKMLKQGVLVSVLVAKRLLVNGNVSFFRPLAYVHVNLGLIDEISSFEIHVYTNHGYALCI